MNLALAWQRKRIVMKVSDMRFERGEPVRRARDLQRGQCVVDYEIPFEQVVC